MTENMEILDLLDRECLGETTRNDLDKLADCSGDEQGEVASSESGTDRMAECSGDEEKLHLDIADGDSDPVSSEDEETKVLLDRKKQLETEKSRLKDERYRKRQLREQRKIKLKAEVKTLENEVAELSITGLQSRY